MNKFFIDDMTERYSIPYAFQQKERMNTQHISSAFWIILCDVCDVSTTKNLIDIDCEELPSNEYESIEIRMRNISNKRKKESLFFVRKGLRRKMLSPEEFKR